MTHDLAGARPAPQGPAQAQRPYLPALDALRIVAVIGVVGVHVLASPASQQEVGIGWQALRMLLATAVPIFLMISGALTLVPAVHGGGPRRFLRRRAGRILPALVVWSAFYMTVVQRWMGEPPLEPPEIAVRLVTGETFTHLYFLWAIAGLYLMAPVIAAFLDQAGDEREQGRRAWVLGTAASLWTLTVMAIPALTGSSMEPVQQGSLTYPLVFMGYFVLGRAATAAPLPRAAAIAALAACAPLILTMTLVAGAAEDQRTGWHRVLMPSYVSPLVVACSVLLFAAAVSLTRTWQVGSEAQRVLRTLGNATFGVFLMHFAVLIAAQQLFAQLSAPVPGAMLALWAGTSACSFALALLGRRVPGLRRIL